MSRFILIARHLKKHRKTFQLIVGILVVLVILSIETKAQTVATQGFIYGKVYTRENTYTGQIRWGKEEAYWIDRFNGAKVKGNDYSKFVKKKSNDGWDFDWKILSIWEDSHSMNSHQFSCQFGDIVSIEMLRSSRVKLTLKNGVMMQIDGNGYNDLDADIHILDQEIGTVKLNWTSINKIEFMATPNIKQFFGAALQGTVQTARKGNFTGLIQWDLDERIGTDKLDGDTRDGDMSIAFSNIKSIEKRLTGSDVVLKSGRKFYLNNSNDVDNSNRGIIVYNNEFGFVEIPWRAFEKVTFSNSTESGPAYDDFITPKGLKGTVYLFEGSPIKGGIVYDIDEKWEFETLEGQDDEIEYTIPFRKIRKIKPKNYDYAMVELKNGKQLLLGGLRDVSDQNDGLLIFTKGADKPKYIKWEKISEIVFD